MARIEEKIAEIADPALRQIIGEEVAKLKKHTRFGLVFEEHQPEVVPIYGRRIKRGERVAKKIGNLSEIWRVVSVKGSLAVCEKEKGGKTLAETRESFPTQQLVVIRSMGEAIYPSLTPVDAVTNGDPAAPHHVLIEADNYHALQLLLFPYEGKVDCIYIDPPYNTGARDWKYNNDYVDRNDQWQHSKWLTFMAKRLRLAKRLLNPETGVMIVTIDEHEVHHLGMLLEREFPDVYRQMVTIVITARGVAKQGLARVEEYAHYVYMGSASAAATSDDLLNNDANSKKKTPWASLLRRGTNAAPFNRPGLVYPILLNPETNEIIGVGETVEEKIARGDFTRQQANAFNPNRTKAEAWPIRSDGSLGTWQVKPSTLLELKRKGFAKIGRFDEDRISWAVNYLKRGPISEIERGELLVTGHEWKGGPAILEYADQADAPKRAKTVWHRTLHDAGTYGSGLIRQILGNRAFEFPKSLYAVRDTLSTVVSNNKSALVIDFFAGSGTTLNAINLLNATDGGNRRCILVTNNEVSADDAETLRERGVQPGDTDWEAVGICRSVTWPRSKFTIVGHRDDGTQLTGEYFTGKQVTREKPRTIRQLGFAEGRNLPLAQRKQVAALLPGITQSKINDGPWFLDDDVAVSVLWDVRQAPAWLEELSEADHVNDLCVVTTESRLFNSLKAQIVETLGAQEVAEEEKRPLAIGFAANLEYFRLDFLDPQEIQMGRQFAAVLPILWMMAGARGPRPNALDAHAPWLLPDGCPFVVLMQETRFKEFVRHVESRSDLTHVFIVTNSQDTVYKLRHEWPELRVVQLYKDYLENFRINLSEKPAQ
jgi:adenine-specific DNA-methyltransferase